MIAQRVQGGSGCPYCTNRKVLQGFNDLATVQPLIGGQWHESLNGALTPEMVTAGSHKKDALTATCGKRLSTPEPARSRAAVPSAPEEPSAKPSKPSPRRRAKYRETLGGNNMKRRLLASILSFVMVLSLMPITAMADGEDDVTPQEPAVDVTMNNPYFNDGITIDGVTVSDGLATVKVSYAKANQMAGIAYSYTLDGEEVTDRAIAQ